MRLGGGAPSRRVFLRTSGLLVAGGALAACGSSGNGTQTTTTDQTTTLGGSAVEGDIALLNSTLDLELEAVEAYTAARAALSGRWRLDMSRFAEHEREHADAIGKAIDAIGGKPNTAKDDYEFPALESAEAAEAVLEFLVGVENNAIAWYIDALPKFSTPELRGVAASIATVEAEQLTVLLGMQDRPQVTEAFMLGRKT